LLFVEVVFLPIIKNIPVKSAKGLTDLLTKICNQQFLLRKTAKMKIEVGLCRAFVDTK